MTKETRFGLLVGMVFIIAFGLILSELTGTDAAPPVPPAEEEYLGAYGHAPSIEDVPLLPEAGRAVASLSGPPGSVAPGPGAVVEATLSHRPGIAGARSLVEAQVHPRPAVLAATVEPRDAAVESRRPPPPVARAPRRRVYVVQPGDTLIRIARKVYGRGKDLEYKRIYNANKSALPDESTLSIGQELVIPPLPGREVQPVAQAGGAASRLGPSARPAALAPAPAPRRRGSGERVVELDVDELGRHFGRREASRGASRGYVVRRGDCLTGIARRLLRDDSPETVRKLYEANRDRLRSPHCLQVGMRLQIPS